MVNLFTNYSVAEIIIFIIAIAFAIKEGVTFFDWARARVKQSYNKEAEEQEVKSDIIKRLDTFDEVFEKKEKCFENKKQEINNSFKALEEQIRELAENVNLLISSDRDDIRAYIVDKHHYFCNQQKWIDDFSLDCLEKRYKHYTAEGGNSYIEDLMKDIRKLPKKLPQ